MPDVYDKKTRSRVMSRIRAKDTKAEIALRKALWREGVRGYRVHYKLPGKPDIVFTKKKVVVFVDGDFWHGYTWKTLGKVPPKEYWQDKIQGNIDRDKIYNEQYRKDGWRRSIINMEGKCHKSRWRDVMVPDTGCRQKESFFSGIREEG